MKQLYFKHDVDASSDLKLRRLMKANGPAAGELYWRILEVLYSNNGSFDPGDIDVVADDIYMPAEEAQKCLKAITDVELLSVGEDGMLHSRRADSDIRDAAAKCDQYRQNVLKRYGKTSSKNNGNSCAKQQDYSGTTMVEKENYNGSTTVEKPFAGAMPERAIAPQGQVQGQVQVQVRERDCSDSLHSSSLPPDDEKSPAGAVPEAKSPETPPLGFDEPLKPDEPVFLEFPRIGKTEPYGVTESDVAKWEGLFPAIDVRQTLRNALAWLNANPKNGKSNIPRFLTSWLTREQDKAGPQRPGAQPYRRVASDRTPGYDLGRTHVFDNTRPGGEVRT